MPREELSVLAAFAVVADQRSFTRAAVRLGVSTSAVSHSIRTLAERLRRQPARPDGPPLHPVPHGRRGPIYRWEFEKRGKPVTVSVSGPLVLNDVDLTLRAALDGVGLAFALEEHVAERVARGEFVRVLAHRIPPCLSE